MWDLPGPELEPVSPALAGGFLTTVLPGKSLETFFILKYYFKNRTDPTKSVPLCHLAPSPATLSQLISCLNQDADSQRGKRNMYHLKTPLFKFGADV